MLFFALSCIFNSPLPDTSEDTLPQDADGDGYLSTEDCNDLDPAVHSGLPFTCVWSQLPSCSIGQNEVFTEDFMTPPEWNSNSYVVPQYELRVHLMESIQAALQGDAQTALQSSTSANYHLCSEESTLIWSAPRGSGGAALALRTHPSALNVIIETPHSFFDLGTLGEGITIFQRTNARALLSSGTHRCASDTASPCSGQTQVCTLFSSEDFRISDMAHTDTSFFHAAHLAIADGLPETTILQLHMFLDPGASVSNGKRDETTSDQPSARLAEALTQELPDELVTSCNDYGAGNTEDRTCGTSNTQGRHLNNSDDACEQGASSASGRFIHLEQNVSVIEKTDAISAAILEVFQP